MSESLNKDLEYLSGGTTTSEETTEEESTTTSEEITEEVVIYSEVVSDELLAEIQTQNSLLQSNYDMLTFIFIVLLFILFKTYIVHFLDSIRSMGK